MDKPNKPMDKMMDKPNKETPDHNAQIEKELNFSDGVIEKIAGQTIHDIDGVLELSGGMMSQLADRFRDEADPTKGVDADIDDQEVTIELDAILEYGKSAPDIFEQTTDQIAKSVHKMTGLNVTKIKMNVSDLLTKKEWAAKQEAGKKDNKDNE
ncbi:Asp23/Gls24 family envelope stress response protein [Latilactobacillus sakei]|uniref:Asp23/Gls24 family envelope stress response protein n=1 Tax=Latilactobacillus sakei TaxID=1599 RepID=UPI0020213029|nr:Asp23/Gls24 family envelope stress response protein [Latilactobacillus sakei]